VIIFYILFFAGPVTWGLLVGCLVAKEMPKPIACLAGAVAAVLFYPLAVTFTAMMVNDRCERDQLLRDTSGPL